MSFKLFTRTYATSDKPDKAIIAIHGWKGDEYVFEQVAKLINLEILNGFSLGHPIKQILEMEIPGLEGMMKSVGNFIKHLME